MTARKKSYNANPRKCVGTPKTVAVDFDGVIHAYTSAWTRTDEISDGPTEGALDAIRGYMDAGFNIVIFSARANDPAGKAAIEAWLIKHKFPEGIRVTSDKPQAVLYIDDRGFHFTGKWPTAAFIREFIPWNHQPMVKPTVEGTCIVCLEVDELDENGVCWACVECDINETAIRRHEQQQSLKANSATSVDLEDEDLDD
jgi:hypothetical protein